MLTKISKLNLSYLTKSCRHTLSPNEKILPKFIFLSHFETMAIDSANPAKHTKCPSKSSGRVRVEPNFSNDKTTWCSCLKNCDFQT